MGPRSPRRMSSQVETSTATTRMKLRTSGVSGDSRLNGPLGLAHRPAAWASPSDVSRSRSRAASLGRQARDPGAGARAGGVQVHAGDPEHLLERAGLHVDVLHPAVGHDDQPAEHHAVPDVEVLVALGVGPPARVAAHQHPAHARPTRRTTTPSGSHSATGSDSSQGRHGERHEHGSRHHGDEHPAHPGQRRRHRLPGVAGRREEVVHGASLRRRTRARGRYETSQRPPK